MKKLLAFLMALVIIPCALLFTSCDKIKNFIEQDIVDTNGLFKKQAVYNINQKIGDNYMSAKITFEHDGTGSLAVQGDEGKSGKIDSYKVNGNLIEYVSDGKTQYFDYYKDFIAIPLILSIGDTAGYLGSFIGVREGQVISERSSTEIIGYHVLIYVNKDSLPAVFTGKEDSKGSYVTYYKNGTVSDKVGYLSADQVFNFDSSEVGIKVIDVSIQGKKYKTILNVVEPSLI